MKFSFKGFIGQLYDDTDNLSPTTENYRDVLMRDFDFLEEKSVKLGMDKKYFKELRYAYYKLERALGIEKFKLGMNFILMMAKNFLITDFAEKVYNDFDEDEEDFMQEDNVKMTESDMNFLTRLRNSINQQVKENKEEVKTVIEKTDGEIINLNVSKNDGGKKPQK